MANLGWKDYAKAFIQGTLVAAFSSPVGVLVGKLPVVGDPLGAMIPLVGVSIATGLGAGAIAVVSSLALDKWL